MTPEEDKAWWIQLKADWSAPKHAPITRDETRNAQASGLADDALAIARETKRRKTEAIAWANRTLKP